MDKDQHAEPRGASSTFVFHQCAKWLGMVVVALSLVIGLSDYRCFPFTNFPMFAKIYATPSVITVGYRNQNGAVELLPVKILAPLTRLFLRQTISQDLKQGRAPRDSLNWLIEKIRRRWPHIHTLVVVRLNLAIAPEKPHPYETNISEILYEIEI